MTILRRSELVFGHEPGLRRWNGWWWWWCRQRLRRRLTPCFVAFCVRLGRWLGSIGRRLSGRNRRFGGWFGRRWFPRLGAGRPSGRGLAWRWPGLAWGSCQRFDPGGRRWGSVPRYFGDVMSRSGRLRRWQGGTVGGGGTLWLVVPVGSGGISQCVAPRYSRRPRRNERCQVLTVVSERSLLLILSLRKCF